jgi:anti-sigma B factor antagonist
MRLSVTIEGEVLAIGVEGNLDYYTAPQLREEIEFVMGSSAKVIEVRLGAINLIDSSGLSALVCAYKLSRARGKELVLRGRADSVARLLRRTSLDRVIPLRPPHGAPSETEPGSAAASA